MIEVNYDFYTDVYGGTKVKEPTKFTRLAMDAEMLIHYYTFGRIDKVEDESLLKRIKLTICKLVDEDIDIEHNGNLKSESEGKQSFTYVDPVSPKKRKYDIIYTNLVNTDLMYRGVSS